jgi:hypothetical protein
MLDMFGAVKGMFVIVSVGWVGGWMGKFGSGYSSGNDDLRG